MPRYVDGFVIPIKKSNLAAYKKLAAAACEVWLDHGALEYRECVGEDMEAKCGLPFPKAVKSRPPETIVFAWIVYKSRKDRDRVNAKVMKDPRMNAMAPAGTKMPFDLNRLITGGFSVIVDSADYKKPKRK